MSLYPFVETIRVHNGSVQNLIYHQNRLNATFLHFYPGQKPHDLQKSIKIPDKYSSGLYKLRFLYNKHSFYLEYHPYKPKQINCLKTIHANHIDYRFKKTDRTQFEELLSVATPCNEILIVKNGFITDTSFSNIVFFDGKKWITPTTYLLAGTYRQYLLDTKKITQMPIRLQDITSFTYFKLINALLAWDMQPMPVEKIII